MRYEVRHAEESGGGLSRPSVSRMRTTGGLKIQPMGDRLERLFLETLCAVKVVENCLTENFSFGFLATLHVSPSTLDTSSHLKAPSPSSRPYFPPDAPMSDPHADLGLRPGASDAEVKAAFRRLAHVHHPDKHTDETRAASIASFNRITAARNRLLGGAVGGGGGRAGNHGASAWAHTGATTGIRNANKVSNLGFAVVLTFPFALIAVVSQWAFPSDTVGFVHEHNETSDHKNPKLNKTKHMGRIHGTLHPPVNPWLRDDVLELSRNKGQARPALAERIGKRLGQLYAYGTSSGSINGFRK